ncbi:MAG: hypothetical protein IJQ44_08195 [Bacteroidaceae bacterium]|nr:hypothetical protein [Bacteroidaceae bacterium]
MNLTKPIDITAVLAAVKKHQDLLVSIRDKEAAKLLMLFAPLPGVKDSVTIGRTELGSVSRGYTGEFLGQLKSGRIMPRTLTVHRVVMEMDDEPERYRRWYLGDIAAGIIPNTHPFELWLNNYGIQCASEDLAAALLCAKHNENKLKDGVQYSFDGPLTIVEEDIADGNISVAKGNMYATGELTRANVGTKLLEMWRSRPKSFRDKASEMWISSDVKDLYVDWLEDQGVHVTGTTGEATQETKYLRNTGGKVRLVEVPYMPANSQFVQLMLPRTIFYGFDKNSDMNHLNPFPSGNPYHYTATGSYVIGFQLVSINPLIYCCNERPIVSYTEVETTTGKNPVNEGWFVLSSGKYVLATDETPQEGTTYYVRNV